MGTKAVQDTRRREIITAAGQLNDLFLELIQEGQQKGIFARNIPHPHILAANVLSLGYQWALQKTWRFAPETDLETYICAQLAYFHTQLLGKTGNEENPDPRGNQRKTTLPDHLSST